MLLHQHSMVCVQSLQKVVVPALCWHGVLLNFPLTKACAFCTLCKQQYTLLAVQHCMQVCRKSIFLPS